MISLRRYTAAFLFIGGPLACSDYKIVAEQDSELGADDTDWRERTWIDTAIIVTHACIDVEDDLATEVSIDDSCAFEPDTSMIEITEEWRLDSFNSYTPYTQVVMTPVVGQLNDDTLDGIVDENDTPDIVIVTDDGGASSDHKGVLRIIDGLKGQVTLDIFRLEVDEDVQAYPYRYSNVALGDIDSDGDPEIVVLVERVDGMGGGDSGSNEDTSSGDSAEEEEDTDNPIDPPPPSDSEDDDNNCYVAAIEVNGDLLWLSQDATFMCGGHAPALADLEGDGTVEVVVASTIFEGSTGDVRGSGADAVGWFFAYNEIGSHTVIADLDGDQVQEVIAGGSVYSPEGLTLCGVGQDTAGIEPPDGFAAVADMDGDNIGDVVVVGNSQITIFEGDYSDGSCDEIASFALPDSGNGGPPTISDFDGDQEPEIGVASAYYYSVIEADGSLLWSMPVDDASSHATGSSVYDFESDGRPEVVYADESRLWVFDGPTGAVRLEDADHTSRTLHEYPTIADVDGDGEAEIIVANGGSNDGEAMVGIRVLGTADEPWPAARQVWNQHAYSITNINDDLSIPSPPESNWPDHNNFRSGDLTPPAAGTNAPDAVPLVEVCLNECEYDNLILAISVGNSGPSTMQAGIPFSVYVSDDSTSELLRTRYTSESLKAGEVSEPHVITLDASEFDGGTEVSVSVDDNGINNHDFVVECDETNNVKILDNDEMCD